MDAGVGILLIVVALLGGFTGGTIYEKENQKKMPAKYQYDVQVTEVKTTTDVETRTEVVTKTEQGQKTYLITIPYTTNAQYYNWQVGAHTNVDITKTRKSNTSCVTTSKARTNMLLEKPLLALPKIGIRLPGP